MSTNERRPLLRPTQTHSFIRQPAPERIGSYRVEHSGKTSHARTFINSVNILVGAGLLSLPLAFRYTGWILGFILLTLSAGMCAYAARSLTQCLDQDDELQSYVDIAGAAFGPAAQMLTSILFSLIMVVSCVALTVLFGDAMSLLVPSISSMHWKMIFGLAILPMQFASLWSLAPLSVLGIVSGVGIVATTLIAGLVKGTSPGSLRDPVPTSMTPSSLLEVSLSVGLFLAPWGASACIPSFYRDMKDPRTCGRCIVESFALCYAICAIMGGAGYLMFGSNTSKEIIHNILSLLSDYPRPLIICMVAFTSLMPITKATLCLRPFINMLDECFSGVQEQSISVGKAQVTGPGETSLSSGLKLAIRFTVVAIIILLSIAVPDFDRVIAIMGSALCCPISILLPSAFHLKLLRRELSWAERCVDYVFIGIAGVLTVIGTAGAALA